MSDERNRMIKALKQHVVPVLREHGFKGSFPHFRRPTKRALHLVTFQFDKWGGGFVVEIAACPPDGVRTPGGEHIPPTKVSTWHVGRRLRLGASDEKSDYWFRYDKRRWFSSGDRFERTALRVLPYLSGQAEGWWKRETDEQERSA